MDSAERAIRARLSLVDLILEVRVARVPASSAFEPLHLRRPVEPDGRQVYMLNKGDLAEAYEIKKWMAYMKKKRTCPCIAVNSHKRESTKEGFEQVNLRPCALQISLPLSYSPPFSSMLECICMHVIEWRKCRHVLGSCNCDPLQSLVIILLFVVF
ncbi:hypothetical protein PAHAL_1G170000 [Panicum hallii]|uniref:Uncharacterized protein n=1 Tax=Panicum hallii TaxID=206008 RepID=A0A2T8KVG7_9POAL|nr:short integuments 2, mitochondrial-like isoform X2 [Panicum hallii]PVH66166.1 hypothetical protein PAHAL_1G170000 [Panicum hallii]